MWNAVRMSCTGDGDATRTCKRKRLGTAGLAALAGAMLSVPTPALAEAQCARWDVSGQWYITQSNIELGLTFNLQQKGNVVTGRARWSEMKGEPYLGIFPRGKNPVPHFGSVDGTLNGAQLELQVYWPEHKAIGVYTGQIGPRGRIEGATFDKLHPANRATWFSDSLMQCAAVGSQPVRALGKRKSKNKPQDAELGKPMDDLKVLEGQQVNRLRLQPGIGVLSQPSLKVPCVPPKC